MLDHVDQQKHVELTLRERRMGKRSVQEIDPQHALPGRHEGTARLDSPGGRTRPAGFVDQQAYSRADLEQRSRLRINVFADAEYPAHLQGAVFEPALDRKSEARGIGAD